MTRPLRVFLIAGEPSGDQLGAHLIAGLHAETGGTVEFDGVGGAQMAAAGLASRFDMSELSVMGLVEVLPRLPGLLRRARDIADLIVAEKPDALITIDSPDFCLRVAAKVRSRAPGIRTIHYVAPSVWAWRPGRAAKMARHIDHVLALLPFEPPLMQAAGMTCDFVGHPASQFPVIDPEEALAFRADAGIDREAPLLALLPGSRRGEVARHGDIFRDTVARVSAQIPGLRVVVPVAPGVGADVRAAVDGLGAVLVENTALDQAAGPPRKFAAFAAADAALAVSGTVSLELAAQSTPMVIGWTTSAISRWLIRRAFLLDTATLVNLVSETRAVPEFMLGRCRAELIAPCLTDLLRGTGAAEQADAARTTMARLGRGGDPPGRRAAQSVLSAIG